MRRQPRMRTIAPAIPRYPPQLHTLPGKGKKHPIPRCPPVLIGINLAPGKAGKTVGENVRDLFESITRTKAKI